MGSLFTHIWISGEAGNIQGMGSGWWPGPGQGLRLLFRRGNLKVLISDGPGVWGCLQRGEYLWSNVVLLGVCRSGGL